MELDDSDASSDGIDAQTELEAGTLTLMTPQQRGTVSVVTREVAAALDRTNTSDRNAAHIISAMASTSQLRQVASQLIISPALFGEHEYDIGKCSRSRLRLLLTRQHR